MVDPNQLIPLHDRVLVRKLPQQPKLGEIVWIRDHEHLMDVVDGTTDGQHGDYRRVPTLGVIISVGPGKHDAKWRFKPTSVKPGETVIFTNWNDTDELPKDYFLIREADIWGYPSSAEFRLA